RDAGLVHDWSISAEILRSASIPCILAGGLDAGNLRDALEAVEPWGVDSYSRTNLPSLRKDLAKVRAFVEGARRFDAERYHRYSSGGAWTAVIHRRPTRSTRSRPTSSLRSSAATWTRFASST